MIALWFKKLYDLQIMYRLRAHYMDDLTNAFLNMFNESCSNKKKQGIETQEPIPIKIWLSHKNQPNILQFNVWQGIIFKKINEIVNCKV